MHDEPGPKDPPDAEASTDEPYEPPAAEDVETTHAPSESAPGPGSPNGNGGIEDTQRW